MTSMHSSRMRTACTLTIVPVCVCGGGVVVDLWPWGRWLSFDPGRWLTSDPGGGGWPLTLGEVVDLWPWGGGGWPLTLGVSLRGGGWPLTLGRRWLTFDPVSSPGQDYLSLWPCDLSHDAFGITSPPDLDIDACENITFARFATRVVKIWTILDPKCSAGHKLRYRNPGSAPALFAF